ncbi:MAG: hypothetical protein ACYC8T_20530 [Myxococcaceae bacterium]
MTAKNGKQVKLQDFVMERLEEARERITGFENEAEEVLKGLAAKGKEQRKELEKIIEKLNGRELRAMETRAVKQLGKSATRASTEVKKRFEDLQAKVLEATGVASSSQVKEINKELSKLGKKLDSLLGKKPSRSDVRA